MFGNGKTNSTSLGKRPPNLHDDPLLLNNASDTIKTFLQNLIIQRMVEPEELLVCYRVHIIFNRENEQPTTGEWDW